MQYLKLHASVHSLWHSLWLIDSYKSKMKIETTFYENKKIDV